jgi:RecJ-like exonuclease
MSKPDNQGRPMSAFLNAHHTECAANDARNLADQKADEAYPRCDECGKMTDNPVNRHTDLRLCEGCDDALKCDTCGAYTDNDPNRRTGDVTCDECEDTAQAGAAMRDPHFRARYGD